MQSPEDLLGRLPEEAVRLAALGFLGDADEAAARVMRAADSIRGPEVRSVLRWRVLRGRIEAQNLARRWETHQEPNR